MKRLRGISNSSFLPYSNQRRRSSSTMLCLMAAQIQLRTPEKSPAMKFSQWLWWMWRRSFRMSDEPREESARPTNFLKRSVILVGKSSSSKSTLGRDFHKLFHLLDRREVQTACMVGRNDSMWRTSASDNALILWTTC